MKKVITILLAFSLVFGIFAGCGNKKETQKKKVKDDGIMKILMIGHSTGMDSAYMLPAIAKNEGVEKLVVGMLYHSGCRLGQHVDYLTTDAAQYAYYEFDIETQDGWLRADCDGNFTDCAPFAANDIYIEDGSIAQTMKFGIQRHDWDIIVMQAGGSENANLPDGSYAPNFASDIKTIQDYVVANDIEKSTAPKFAWNMVWGCPEDISMVNGHYKDVIDTLFNGDPTAWYPAIIETNKNIIQPEKNFTWFMPSATAKQNAQAMGVPIQELYRDYIHGSDYTRMMVSYLWYCVLFNKNIDDCTLAPIPAKLVFDAKMYNTGTPFELTEEQKNILKSSIKNAIANPYEVTN